MSTNHEQIAVILDQTGLTIDEFSISCTVPQDWVIEHVQAGVLLNNPANDPQQWSFTSYDIRRARRIYNFERQFDANPELAGLVADLVDELESLQCRLRRAEKFP